MGTLVDWTMINMIDAENAYNRSTDTLARIRWAVVLDTLASL